MISRYRSWIFSTLVLSVYLFLYLPILVMVAFSFNDTKIGYVWTGFTTKWYEALLHNGEMWFAVQNTAIIAFSSVLLSAVLGMAVVYCFGRRYQQFFSIFYLSAMIPEIVMAVGLISVFTFFVVPLGINTLIIGHTLLGLGFMVPILHTRYLELDPRLIEASYDLGATQLQTFWRVIIPFMMPALVSGTLLVFIISLDDFLISYFCTGPASQTLSLYIFATIRSGVSPVINALSTCMLVLSCLLVLLYSSIGKRSGDAI